MQVVRPIYREWWWWWMIGGAASGFVLLLFICLAVGCAPASAPASTPGPAPIHTFCVIRTPTESAECLSCAAAAHGARGGVGTACGTRARRSASGSSSSYTLCTPAPLPRSAVATPPPRRAPLRAPLARAAARGAWSFEPLSVAMAQTPQAEILKQREEKKREAAAAPREVRRAPTRAPRTRRGRRFAAS